MVSKIIQTFEVSKNDFVDKNPNFKIIFLFDISKPRDMVMWLELLCTTNKKLQILFIISMY